MSSLFGYVNNRLRTEVYSLWRQKHSEEHVGFLAFEGVAERVLAEVGVQLEQE